MSRFDSRKFFRALLQHRHAAVALPAPSEASRLAETGQGELPLSRDAPADAGIGETDPGDEVEAEGEAEAESDRRDDTFGEAAHTQLFAICRLSGARAGAVMLQNEATTAPACHAAALYLDGSATGRPASAAAPALQALGAACALRSDSVMAALADRRSHSVHIEFDAELPLPDGSAVPPGPAPWLVRHSALRQGGRSVGYLLLAFHGDRLPDAATLDAVDRLGQQLMIVRAHLIPQAGLSERSAAGSLAIATQALHNAIEGLARVDDLPAFLEALLGEALKAAGTGHGAVVLIERERDTGVTVARHTVMLVQGVLAPTSVRRALNVDRVPVNKVVTAFAERVAAAADGVASVPEDKLYTEPFRNYLVANGVRSIHSMRLRVGGQMIGWFGVGYPERAPIGPDRSMLLRLLADQMTIAVELTRMAEQAKQAAVAQAKAHDAQVRIDKLMKANQALTRAIDVLSSDTGVDTMLGHTLRLICDQLFDAEGAGALWMVDPVTGLARRHLVDPGGRTGAGESIDLPHDLRDAALFGSFDSPPQPHTMTLEAMSPAQRAFFEARGWRGLLGFPMRAGRAIFGAFVVCLWNDAPEPSAENIQVCRALAQQATLAVQLTRFADDSRRAAVAREKEASAELRVGELVKANGALRRSLDLISDETDSDDRLGRMLQVVSEQVACHASTLCMRVDGSDVFRLELAYRDGVVTRAEPHEHPSPLCPAPGTRLWHALADERRPVVFDSGGGGDAAHDMDAWFAGLDARTLLGVPLLQRAEVIGCFTFRFGTPRRFSPEQLELLQTLAHQTTLAVQLERLARAAQTKSHRAATLAERARIARDLHDTLAQGLTGILMHLQAAQRTPDAGRVQAHVGEALDVARGALVDARRSVHALRSMTTERVDFVAALRGVLKTTFAGSAVATDVSGGGDFSLVPEPVENELLRIAQEAATNALKHGRASRFDVWIGDDKGTIELGFQDNGVGFDTGVEQDGFGLTGIQERALRIGARLTLTSQPGAGTRITVALSTRAAMKQLSTPAPEASRRRAASIGS